MKQYVIIGGGVSCIGCVEGIRSVDKNSEIILIFGEKHPVYCRPLISYYLGRKTDLQKMEYRPESFYIDNKCKIIYAKAEKIEKAEKNVILDDGRKVHYDCLCIATGSSPFVPPFEGLNCVKKRCTFMTIDDALYLEKEITPESKVLIVGAGLIGLKCAEGLCGRVKKITVCDLATRVLSSILDDTCAKIMQNKLEEHGITFMLDDTVQTFGENTAHMKSGQTVDFDIVVLAIGVRANDTLIREIGGECDRGIIVDTSMKTSVENIYAAGDCSQGFDASIGKNSVLAIWPNAYMQGNCAGVNMASGNKTFENSIPMNAIGFFGYHALTAGSNTGELYEEREENNMKRLFVENGCLTGFMLLGNIDRAGIYTSLVRDKTPLDSIDFELIKNNPSFAAFLPKTRRQKFGGVV